MAIRSPTPTCASVVRGVSGLRVVSGLHMVRVVSAVSAVRVASVARGRVGGIGEGALSS